jgi:hypothetical protein
MASFQLWTFFVSILIVGVVADFVAGLFTAGGKRAPRIPMSGSSHIQSSGFVYLAFFIGVIAAALLSSYILGGILGNLVASDLGGQFLLGSGAALLVWFDMRRRLYRR